MKSHEFVVERKRKRRPRWAAYGPGPYGGYGYYTGYSGDGGSSGGDGGGGESIKHEASYPGNIGMMELAKFFSMADEEQKTLFKQLLERGKKGLAWKLVQDIVGVKLQGQEFDDVKEAEASDDELRQRYGDFDSEDKPMLPTTRVGGAPAPTLWTAYETIQSILGKNRVTDDEEEIEPGMYYVYQSSASPMFTDTEDSGPGGSINIPNLESKAAKDVAIAAHEACHAYVHDRTKGSGRVHANEKIINNLAEKWLRKHLSGTALHVAIETITGSRISYGKDHMPQSRQANENFADGKKPGRKGLAKRSGVNTKASVSSLRKTAKNSSGEKARMAHWLANMKAGRAKKNK
jgi:hypothetical protein